MNVSLIRGGGARPKESMELRETLDYAFQSGSRLLENRLRLAGLDFRDSLRARTRGASLIVAGVIAASVAWLFLMMTFASAIWEYLPREAVFGVIFAFNFILAMGLFIFGKHALDAARANETPSNANQGGLND